MQYYHTSYPVTSRHATPYITPSIVQPACMLALRYEVLMSRHHTTPHHHHIQCVYKYHLHIHSTLSSPHLAHLLTYPTCTYTLLLGAVLSLSTVLSQPHSAPHPPHRSGSPETVQYTGCGSHRGLERAHTTRRQSHYPRVTVASG